MSEVERRISRHELVTLGDLDQFKVDILEGIGSMLNQQHLSAKKWLKSKEVRKLLNVSPGKLQAMRNKRELPYTPLGGVFYYDEKDVQDLLEKNKVK
ncbi:MAG: helix-turn-helix domain-containing protein [Candidatus Pedobacter colombiensis]|uniref:Helix-turn-helix domain-containing protein n=1 Tax=Candidatus Pedobacter colombiensis TaxID=3121371 RepID=A0AAJ5WD15_9SPHI|nr:helix-turn-helix domain-containing protein [Pedobacter sp.]WEK21371.1 MAG: helix-turn-helix domain-containing protein [Pedobacter sp.]